MRSAGWYAAALALAVMHGGAVQAEVAEQRYQMGMSLDTVPDRWELPRHHVDPLVTTPSSRMTLNAHLHNFFRAEEGILLGVDGRVHWRDRAEGLEPPLARSEYELQGVDVQAHSGYRFGAPGDAIRYDMRVGLGYRGVSRDSRWAATGADEDIGVLYTQFSGGPRFASGGWQAFLEMGVRVPVDSNDASLGYLALDGVEPAGNGRRSAGFVSFQNLFQLSDSSALRLDLYYDSQRYGLSDTPRWQSLYRDDFTGSRDRDVFGFEMGVNF
jgi:hypothetical protein